MVLSRHGAILSYSFRLCAVCSASTVGENMRPSQTEYDTKVNYVSYER
jgi:hypothetical protein